MPIVLVFLVTHVKLTLFLRHHLLLWPVALSLGFESSDIAMTRQTVNYLPMAVLVGQLLDKGRDCGVDCGTIDKDAQFVLQKLVRDGELILKRIEAFVPGSPYDLVNVSGRPPPLSDRGNGKLMIIELAYGLDSRVLKSADCVRQVS
jgi:hypothetical protein